MSEPNAKRRRTDDDKVTTSTPIRSLPIPFPTSMGARIPPQPINRTTNVPSWPDIIATLPEAALRACLLKAVAQNPRVGNIVIAPYLRQATERQTIATVSFNHQVTAVSTAINVTYAHLSGSQQHERSGEALRSVLDAIGQIHDTVADHSSFATKRNGLRALIDIGFEIANAHSDVIAHEVRKHFGFDSCLEDAIYEIVETLGEAEKCSLCAGKWELESQLRELAELAKGFCIFESMHEVLELLTGEPESDGEDDDEDEDK